jgi:CRISPR-associated protein Cmr1
MQNVTFQCEIITPMFMGGADGVTPELRAPSIKGAMRFWWRAMNGGLRLAALKEQEGKIFGDTSSRSKFALRLEDVDIKIVKSRPTPHRGFETECIKAGSTFKVCIMVPVESQVWDIQKSIALFELTCLLGDFGKRARRGMGSVDITQCSYPGWKKQPSTLEHIASLMRVFSDHYTIDGNKIKNVYSGSMEYYPWIRQIQVGEANNGILEKISQITHDFHWNDKNVYEASLGHARHGRFASPVYVSVVKGSLKPVITTLNTIPDRNSRDISLRLQEDFKNTILK